MTETDDQKRHCRHAARNGQQRAKAIREALISDDAEGTFERLAVSFAKSAHRHWRASKRGPEGWEDLEEPISNSVQHHSDDESPEEWARWEADKIPGQKEWYRAWTCGPLGGPYRSEWHRLPADAPLDYYDRSCQEVAAAKKQHPADPCPLCGTPPEQHRWQYARCSTIRGLAVTEWRAWLVMCESCEIGVAAFQDYRAMA